MSFSYYTIYKPKYLFTRIAGALWFPSKPLTWPNGGIDTERQEGGGLLGR